MSATTSTPSGAGAATGSGQTRLRWACVAAALVATVPSLELLSFLWTRADLLAHGYLVPAAFATLCVFRRAALVDAVRNGNPPRSGAPAVGLAVSFAVAGVALDVATLAGLAVPLILAASAWALGGGAALRVAAVPIGLLVFMVPPPPVVVDQIPAALQFGVKDLAVASLRAGGHAIETSGHLVYLTEGPIFVGDPSSGIPTIVTLLPLAAVLAWFASHGVWRRLVVLASVVPFAVFGNAVKIATTVVLAESRGLPFGQQVMDQSYPLVALPLGALLIWALARVLR